MIKIKDLINTIKNYNYKFVNTDFKLYIKDSVIELFPNISSEDVKILYNFTNFIIEKIANKFYFTKDIEYVNQWLQNNKRDIKATILMLIPFINDKNDYENFKKITDLNQILCNVSSDKIPIDLLDIPRDEALKKYFPYSNFALGLIDDKNDGDSLLKLYNNNEKLIYQIIHHNLISVIETLTIMNGKFYVNWINITPISYSKYKKSRLYKNTIDELDNWLDSYTDDNKYQDFLQNYNGLYLGDYYNVIRNYYYQSIKKFKWVIFNKKIKISSRKSDGIYMIQYLDKLVDLSTVMKYNYFKDVPDKERQLFILKFNKFSKNIKDNKVSKYDFSFEKDLLSAFLTFLVNNFSKKNLISNNSDVKKFIIKNFEDEDKDDESYEEIENRKRNQIYNCFKNIEIDYIWEYLKETINILKTSIYGHYLIKNNKINYDYYYYVIEKNKKTFNLKNIYNISKSLSHHSRNKNWSILPENYKSLDLNQVKDFWNKLHTSNDNWLNINRNLKIQEGNGDIDSLANNIFNSFTQKNNGVYIWHKMVWDCLTLNGLLSEFNVDLDITDKSKLPAVTKQKQKAIRKRLKSKIGSNKDSDEDTTKIHQQILYFLNNFELTDTEILDKVSKQFDIRKERLTKELDLVKENIEIDENNKIKNENIILPKDKNRKYYDESIYYLNNRPFGELKSRLDKEYDFEEIKYLDLITDNRTGQLWYSFYAMDWISQINFFNHYINHQIIYVTGATGTGKSTQVPKLLLYAKKVYDYKNIGKVICTQPRIPPTVGNIDWISQEMGVPVLQPSKTISKISTNNYFLQFQTSMSKHTYDNNPGLVLRMVTDGTLVTQILNNPIMKEQISIGKNKTNDKGKKSTIFGVNNSWDIMIVDEAHEHNSNMDLILSLARQSCYYNNSLRLVIVSATMDDDEPIYRSYYKYINDNLLYPLKRSLFFHPIIKNEENFMIYSNYLDRRFHISPPGETTQYTITDFYDEEIKYKLVENNSLNAEMVQKKGYEKVMEICRSSNFGQILFFANGQGEITSAVEELNKKLPSGIIAIPYFSSLNPAYKDIVEKIDKQIKYVRNNKENIYKEWGGKYIVDENVPEGKYKRAVIIATNVAEASITIPDLKFVIDNGYAKVNNYDEKYDESTLDVENISDASRLQRRGRVGRKSDGTVYYLYGKGARDGIMPKYNITQENYQNLFLNLLSSIKKKTDSSGLFWDFGFHHYFWHTIKFDNRVKINFDKIFEKHKDRFFVKSKLFNSLKHQILLNDNFLPFEFYESSTIFQNNYDFLNFRMEDGYLWENVFDLDGDFYIIHPKENNIERNIINKIIRYDKTKEDKLSWFIYLQFIKRVDSKLLLLNSSGNIKLMISTKLNNVNFNKTKLVDRIQSLQGDLENTEESQAYCYMIGNAYGVFNEVCEIYIMLETINKSVLQLAPLRYISYFDTYIPDFSKLYEMYSNKKSDLIAIYNIIKKIKNKFKKLKIFQLLDLSSVLIKKYKDKYDKIKEKYKEESKKKYNNEILDPSESLKDDYNEILDPSESLKDDYNLFFSLEKNGRLNEDSGFLNWINTSTELLKEVMSDLVDNEFSIRNWCTNNYLNADTIYNFMRNYFRTVIKIITIKKDYDINVKELSSLAWSDSISKTINKNLSTEDKIIKSFLMANSFKIGVKENYDDKKYWLVDGGKFDIKRDRRSNPISLCSSIGGSIFYLERKKKFNTNIYELTIITNINGKFLSNSLPLYYNKIYFRNNYNIPFKNGKDITKKLMRHNGRLFDDFTREIVNNWTTNDFIWYNKEELPVIYDYINKVRNQIL